MKNKGSAKPGFAKLVKGYMGFLTGTGKSLSTISSYKSDLDLFERFLRERKKDFYKVLSRDFEAYQVWLEKQGLKINTRRRKILSAKSLVKYAVSRKKVSLSDVQFVRAPERLERLPWIPNEQEYSALLAALPAKTPLGIRNLLVVRLLAETGLTVAELCGLRWDQCKEGLIEVEGKRPRKLRIDPVTAELLSRWSALHKGKHLFPGFNRHGITSEKMTSRGVELFFRQLAKNTGLRSLKPKTLRHFAVVSWLRQGLADSEIQQRLGVHPNYSLHAYRKAFERQQLA